MEKKVLNLALAGFGVVGGGLAQILEENAETILRRTGCQIQIKAILVKNQQKKRQKSFPKTAKICSTFDELVNTPEIDVVIEVMGGIDAPKELIIKALTAGKHVVTANKALLAEQGEELFSLAYEKNLHFGYEASVCGGIPVIQTLRDSLSANKMLTLSGILNGTSNYILSEMANKGISFAEALKEAQDLGYAEADPSLDIGGFDAAHKLTLLIRLAWGVHYPYSEIPVSGIKDVDILDIQMAHEFGYNIKLIGHARMRNGQIEAGVFPTLVPHSYLLAKVQGPNNAISILGNAVGSIFLHGAGAGALPTGSAVAADILEIARGVKANNLGYNLAKLPLANIIHPDEAESPYYIRLTVTDKPGVMRDVAATMAENNVSIAQAIQKGQKDIVPLMFTTHSAKAKNITAVLNKIKDYDFIKAEPVCYRMLPQPENGNTLS